MSNFSKRAFHFLADLEMNNEREWFASNKDRYEAEIREPALRFIEAMGPKLAKVSKHFVADPRKSGGSLMRVYRDTRFSKDKTPYKTNIGIQFRHEEGKDVHAPAFYLHIDTEDCFLGAGIWHPETSALAKIRTAIDEQSSAWKRARDNKGFQASFNIEGESLKRPPRGYDADHPYIDDLKRKDHIAVCKIKAKAITSPDFVQQVASEFAAAKPYVKFLAQALELPF